MSPDAAARAVLDCYPAVSAGPAPVALGNRGGFSGARLWHVQRLGGPLCLRAWPAAGPPSDRLAWIHHFMDRAVRAGLSFVPAVLRTRDGKTWVEFDGRLWEVTTWMPGRADFRERPTEARLRAACTALARLHRAWAGAARPGLCPAVATRLACARDWLALVAAGWRPGFAEEPGDPVEPLARQAWDLLPPHVGRVEALLAAWACRPVRLQPCLCDIWHAHVLFDGDEVTGVVDYGSAKMNHVAADLARLLGSLVGDDEALRQAGLDAYRQVGALSADEEALVAVLDRTGTCLAAANWLRWLYRERRDFPDRHAVAGRLAEIVGRMARWP